jgi:hypothetical protein
LAFSVVKLRLTNPNVILEDPNIEPNIGIAANAVQLQLMSQCGNSSRQNLYIAAADMVDRKL